MRRVLSTLRSRILLSQLAVILVGAVALVIVFELLAPSLFRGSVQSMNEMMSGTMMSGDMMSGDGSVGFLTPGIEQGLEDAFDSSFRRALLVSLTVSTVAAMAVSAVVMRRILAPLQSVREATRRMASGSFDERVELPAEAELAALADDVNTLAMALDTTEERRVRLISEVAHELRTPLSTVEGYLEGLLDGVFEPSEEIFAASGREVKRLKRLADDLNQLSRTEENAYPLELTRIDLAALATDVTNHIHVQFDAKGVSVSIQTRGELIINGDRDRLSQVLTNLLGNALIYTQPGGTVSVTTRSRGGEAFVDVSDTGRGLTVEERTEVFERFYRGDRNAPGGSGIGLTIARSIARRHRGDVTADSGGPGRGSVFTLSIPLA
jgi:histidine kinase